MKKTIIVGLLILMLAMMLTGYAEELPEEKNYDADEDQRHASNSDVGRE